MTSMRDRWNRAFGPVHNAVYRVSKGRVAHRVGKAPVLLLTTTGCKSGQPRTHPLFYVADGERFVVVASNAGQDHHPGWYANLRARPEGVVEVGGRRVAVRARDADEAERAEFWPRAVAIFRGYARYARKTERQIPLVVLEPA